MGSNSIETGEIRKFSGVDYAVFIVLLVIFSVVGLYHAINDRRRKKENPNEFLLGGRSMSVFPVAMSLTVTFMSALTILGTPVEMYVYNTMFMYLMLALVLAMCSAGIIFIPFFYKLGVTSTFQYLEWRFHWTARCLGSFILILQAVVYMSFVLYAPCLALSAVTGLNLWGCVVGVCVVVTFYTTLGGMKAVIWTDTLQFLIMIAGLLAVFIKGCMETGGFSAAWDVAEREGRVKFDDFSFDPATRHSFWSVVVGGGILWTVGFGVNQAQVQRCLSTSSVRKAQLAILVNTPGLVSIVLLTCLIGIVVFSFYLNCDPIKLGIIEKRDQLLPLFVMDVLGDLKGIPGLFVSCTISGSLSSLSSALNAISAAAYTDFIKRFCCGNLSEFRATIVNKILVIVFGVIAIGVAYLASQIDSVLQGSYTVYGILNGPLFGIFVLGMFFPWANTYGALAGTISSLVFMTWIGIGGLVNKVSTAVASPLNIDGCPSNLNSSAANMSVVSTTMSAILANTTAAATGGKSYEGVYRLYTLSYLYYTIVGTVTVVVIGLIVSFLTGYTRPSKVDPRLILPLFDVIFPCLPECILRPLRFGVDHKSKLCETTANGTYKVKVDDDDFEMNGIIPATRDEYQSSMSKDNAGYDSSMDFQEDSSTNTKL